MTAGTGQTKVVTSRIENVRELVARTRYVLFGFDGPICRLFPGHSAEAVARVQAEWLTERGLYAVLTEEGRGHRDPYGMLTAVARRHPGSELVAELEERLTRFELTAARTAMPTAYADPLIRTWTAVGAKLAVATDNSVRTVTSYLDSRRLTPCFAPHVYGRMPDLSPLKPHPAILERALNEMGAVPEASLMIGGTPSDHAAAHRAGVRFLGYARNPSRARLLHEAGVPPQTVTASLEPLLSALRERF
ncbi:HAD family hydrolase [Streptomyces rhizosphaerihabitans]|uniref:HAD family hydrolase n=1 Tax=Streptomyces rhizosphaerihabitans TaxID=1266770 RepID=UPI0021C0F4B5|nr:HAD family phosphatase [Streptomyces rhizosphaerihabitans]MCT9007069.1 HAD family phosphatase [Streptomyces rhizosphaerihabitans]